MQDYTQYIQIDDNSNIIGAFTSAKEESCLKVNKIEIGKGLRQFDFKRNLPKGLINLETGDFNYKWNSKDKQIEEIPEDVNVKITKQKEIEKQELKRKAKEEIFDRFLSEEKSFLEIAEEVRAGLRKKEKEVN